jgi:Pyruvate/2-oxoacid:ferredoxin oxidoreductase delta subunit
VGAVKIYVAAVEALRKKKKTGWNSVCHQNWWFSEFHPPWMLMYFFASLFWISPPIWPNSGFSCRVFDYFTDNSITWKNELDMDSEIWIWDMDPCAGCGLCEGKCWTQMKSKWMGGCKFAKE